MKYAVNFHAARQPARTDEIEVVGGAQGGVHPADGKPEAYSFLRGLAAGGGTALTAMGVPGAAARAKICG